jgi:hypothetical protein
MRQSRFSFKKIVLRIDAVILTCGASEMFKIYSVVLVATVLSFFADVAPFGGCCGGNRPSPPDGSPPDARLLRTLHPTAVSVKSVGKALSHAVFLDARVKREGVFSSWMGRMAVFFSVRSAHADVIPPDVSACQGKQAGDACTVEGGSAGNCAAKKCTRLDYSDGTPPSSVEYDCVSCVTTGAEVATEGTTPDGSNKESEPLKKPGCESFGSPSMSLLLLILLFLGVGFSRRVYSGR